MTSRGILSLYNTLAVQKTNRRLNPSPCMHWTGPGRITDSVRDLLRPPPPFLFTTNLSDSIFCDLGALQTLSRAAGSSPVHPHVTRS